MKNRGFWPLLTTMVVAWVVLLVLLIVKPGQPKSPPSTWGRGVSVSASASETPSATPTNPTCSPDASHKKPWPCTESQKREQDERVAEIKQAHADALAAYTTYLVEVWRMGARGEVKPTPALLKVADGRQLEDAVVGFLRLKENGWRYVGVPKVAKARYDTPAPLLTEGAAQQLTVCLDARSAKVVDRTGKVALVGGRPALPSTLKIVTNKMQFLGGHWKLVAEPIAWREVKSCNELR